jgi:hypothetical protein
MFGGQQQNPHRGQSYQQATAPSAPPLVQIGAASAIRDLPRGRGPTNLGAQALASPSYGVDLVALALAVVLAAAIALLVSQIMPHLADLMMPPALGGATIAQ